MKLLAKTDVDADSWTGLVCQTAVDAVAKPPDDDMAIVVVRRWPD